MAVVNENTIKMLSERLKAWDENFRVLDEISTRLTRVKEDLLEIKESKETEIPTSTPIIPQEIKPIDSNPQPIKLKHAIESVPVFEGRRP